MPDPVTPVTSAPPVSAPTTTESTEVRPVPNGETITREEYVALNRRLDRYYADQRRATEKPATESTEELTTKQQLANLQAERKAEKEAAERRAKRSTVVEILTTQELPGDAVQDLADLIEFRHGAAIKLVGDEFQYEDPRTGERHDLKDFVAGKYINGGKADKYKPPVKTFNAKGTRAGSGAPARVPFGDLSQEDQDKLYREGKAAAYVREDMASGR